MNVDTAELLLLDTNVLINVVRGNDIATRIDAEVGLRQRHDRPLISIISVGEALSLGIQFNWGDEKLRQLHELLSELVPVDTSSRPVLENYARFDNLQLRGGWNMKENDLWIAAAAAASGAVLVTTDKDFDQLHDGNHLRRVWIDPNTRRQLK